MADGILRRMADGIVAEVRALQTMSVLPSSYSVLLMPVLQQCIPESWRTQWLRSRHDSAVSDDDELTVFLKFLQLEITIREEAASRKRSTEGPPAASPGKSTVGMLTVNRKPQPDWVCAACGAGKHGLSACPTYRRMTVPARWHVVKQAGVCFQCLGPHLLRACNSTQCPWCGGSHHSSLHTPPGEQAPFANRSPPVPPPAAARDPAHLSARYSPDARYAAAAPPGAPAVLPPRGPVGMFSDAPGAPPRPLLRGNCACMCRCRTAALFRLLS